MKQNFSHMLIKNRAFVVFIVTVLFIASSSEYAQNSQNMTDETTNDQLQMSTDPPAESYFVPAEMQAEEIKIIEAEAVPTVQYLTGLNKSADSLSQIEAANAFFENSVFVGDSISVKLLPNT